MLQHWVSEGEFYIGGYVVLTFVEPVRLAQYKISYVELAFARPNSVAFSSNTLIAAIPLLPLTTHPQLWVQLLTFKPKCTRSLTWEP